MTYQIPFSQSNSYPSQTLFLNNKNNDKINLTFLVGTDLHLGHEERHPILKNDSFDAFIEILTIAKKRNVDFLLLGGDFFDDANPSHEVLHRSLQILKEHIFGLKKTDYMVNWDEQSPNINENMNISLPIFMIHGNHDYPNHDNFSTIDIMNTLKYVIITTFQE